MLRCVIVLSFAFVSNIYGLDTPSKDSITVEDKVSGIILAKAELINSYLDGKEEWKGCSDSLKALVNNVEKWDTNAWKMVDSWGKPNSGILEGNLNQYGNFDECMNSMMTEETRRFYGKYCLISLEVEIPEKLNDMRDLMYSHLTMRKGSKEFSHRLPHFSDFKWGSCIPSSCPSEITEILLNSTTFEIMGEKFTIVARAQENMCYTKKDTETKIPGFAWIYFGVIVALNVIGTFSTMLIRRLPGHKYLEAFSLKRNWDKLFEIKSGDFAELHGIRSASAIGLLLSHKNMAMLYNPYINRTSMVEILGKPWSVIGRTAIIYTDGFILLSGYLSARSFFSELRRKGRIDILKSSISRYCRLVPSLVTVIVFCTLMLPHLNTGPLWNQVVRKHAELCEANWWRNIIFLHNFYGFENMCLTHTHQLGIDFQLFLISPIIVYALWRWPRNGSIVVIALAIFSSFLRYIATYTNELSVVIYFGVSVSQLLDTANMSYILPHHRLTVYLMGIGICYFLNKFPQCTLKKAQILFLWLIATTGGLAAMMGPYHMTTKNYKYDPNEAAMFNVFSPILWGAFIGWGIIACFYGYGGWLGNLMSWSKFQIFSKLSYSIYLVQFPVFFYNVGTKRFSDNYSPGAMFNIEEYSVVVLFSLLLTMMVEMPVNNLRDTLQKPSDSQQDNVEKQALTSHIAETKDERRCEVTSRKMFKQG